MLAPVKWMARLPLAPEGQAFFPLVFTGLFREDIKYAHDETKTEHTFEIPQTTFVNIKQTHTHCLGRLQYVNFQGKNISVSKNYEQLFNPREQ